MASPRLRAFIRDPGELGLPVNIDQVPIFLGTASSGSIAAAKSFGNLAAVEAEYGMGTLVDVASDFFALGGTTFYALRLTGSVAGAASAIVQSGSGADLLLTGSTHHHDLSVRVVAQTTGTVSGGAQTIVYSLDAWTIEGLEPTYSQPVTLPANGTITIPGTGLTLIFNAAESMAAGEVYTFTTSAPYYSATEVAVATPLVQTPTAGAWTYAVYCGDHATSASAANTVGAAIEAQCTTLFSKLKPSGFLMGASKDTPANVLTAFASSAFDPPFGSVGYGGFFAVNSKSTAGRGFLRLREHEMAGARIAFLPISTDPGSLGEPALKRIVGLDYDQRVEGDSLHDARIAIGRTFDPAIAQGVYINRQRLLAATGSDFVSWQAAATMIAVLRRNIAVSIRYLLQGLRQNADLTMNTSDVAIIEGDLARDNDNNFMIPLNGRGIPGHVSAIKSTVSTTTQLPSVDITTRVRPLGYPTDITLTTMFAREA